MSEKHSISITKTANYFSLGDIKTAQTIWFVLHGYGYSAEHFITKFEPILNDHVAIIAPEGLSKFYLQGVDGRVGSSWMTKENRAEEIDDYVNYLNQLYDNIIAINNNTTLKTNVVGFSQGGATASRWVANGNVKPANFILWASVFPDDMQLSTIPENTNTYILYGDNDKYVSNEIIEKQQKFINSSNLSHQLIKFQGKHDIPKEILIEQASIQNW